MKGIFRYCSENGFFTNNANPRTHSIMSGGNLFVSDEKYDEFLTIYADEISKGNKTLTFSELRSNPIFRMYFDIDILDKEKLQTEFLLRMVRTIQSILRRYFPTSTSRLKCVVCTTETKEVAIKTEIPVETAAEDVENEEGDAENEVHFREDTYIKNGFHIVYPELRVNFDIAIQLRHTIVSEMEKVMGKREIESNPWSDIIDRAPYNNGLKMCGSVKVVACSSCKGQKRKSRKKPEVLLVLKKIQALRRRAFPRPKDSNFDYRDVMTIEKDEFKNSDLAQLYSEYQEHTGILMCMECGDKGWQLEERSYSPTHVVDGDGSLCEDDIEYLQSDRHEAMRWTSIRCRNMDELTPGYAIPNGVPIAPPDCNTKSMVNFSQNLRQISEGLYREVVNSDMFENDARAIRYWKGNDVQDPELLDKIIKNIRELDRKYANLDVKSVTEMHVAKSSDNGHIIFNSAGKTKKHRNKAAASVMQNLAEVNKVSMKKEKTIEIVKRFAVRVSGEGSTYCLNKGAEHTSNTCYFWITPYGISQKCFSRKDRIGTDGVTCQKFMSRSVKISTSVRKALFPELEEPDNGVFNLGVVQEKKNISLPKRKKESMEPTPGKQKSPSKKAASKKKKFKGPSVDWLHVSKA